MTAPDKMPPDAHATSLSLLERVQSNQAQAWDRLVELYAPLVYYWCRRCSLSAEDTADVFQETFQSVAQHINGFRKDRAKDTFRGWLRTITRNKINDLYRKNGDRPAAAGGTDANLRMHNVPDQLLTDDDPSEENVVQQQLRCALETIKDEFEGRTWQAFWRVQIEGHSTDEVAGDLDMTMAAVRKAKYRVLRRLREELKELMD